MKKKVFAVLMAMLLTVLAFNLVLAAEGSWGAKTTTVTPRPVITSCSWKGNHLSLSWTAVPRNTTYIVIARSYTQRCAAVRYTTRGLSVRNLPTGSCPDTIIVMPLQRGASTVMTKAACNH